MNGDSSNEIITLEIRPGAEITLDASESIDPDGNTLNFEWFQYPEAGNYPNNMMKGTLTSEKINITVPEDFQKGQEVHIILRVSDTGSPSLVDYRRVVVYF